MDVSRSLSAGADAYEAPGLVTLIALTVPVELTVAAAVALVPDEEKVIVGKLV